MDLEEDMMISQSALITLILILAVATTLLSFGLALIAQSTNQRLKRIEEKLGALPASES